MVVEVREVKDGLKKKEGKALKKLRTRKFQLRNNKLPSHKNRQSPVKGAKVEREVMKKVEGEALQSFGVVERSHCRTPTGYPDCRPNKPVKS